MSGDVGSRSFAGVAVTMGKCDIHETPQPQQRSRQDRGKPGRERRERVGQVAAYRSSPLAGHVPLPHTDLRVSLQPTM